MQQYEFPYMHKIISIALQTLQKIQIMIQDSFHRLNL